MLRGFFLFGIEGTDRLLAHALAQLAHTGEGGDRDGIRHREMVQ